MKNILKHFTLIAVVCLVASSCEYDETNLESLSNEVDPNATYYLQFQAGELALEIGISPAGEPVEAEALVLVKLLGLPQDQDITVNLTVDGSSTATADMYVLGSNSLVIPAGEVTASTTFTTVSENMPIGDVVKLIINMDSGENTATSGTQIIYDMLRPVPCAWIPGVYTVKMVDTYSDGWQTDDGNGGSGIQVTIDGVVTEIGMCSPYQASTFTCVEGPSSAEDTVEIPVGTQSVQWYFPGDFWGEIAFEIIDPNGVSVYKVNGGEGEAGFMDFQVCSNK
jgi:hypothetical protein